MYKNIHQRYIYKGKKKRVCVCVYTHHIATKSANAKCLSFCYRK